LDRNLVSYGRGALNVNRQCSKKKKMIVEGWYAKGKKGGGDGHSFEWVDRNWKGLGDANVNCGGGGEGGGGGKKIARQSEEMLVRSSTE